MDDGRDNWDLSAVVKSCSSTVKLKPTVEDQPFGCLQAASLTNFHEKKKYDSLLFHDQYSYNCSCCISDLVNPPPPLPSPVDHLPQLDVHARMSGIINVPPPPPPDLFFHHQKPRPFINRIPTTTQDPLCCHRLPAPPPSRSRKRKVQQKRTVTHVTAEKLSSDEWAWRKYGQKPIKGSPYPRNYYRCSSSKGCSARKQVEQNKSDPGIYIVTFTGDHTHPRPNYRNSLAGSTRISRAAANNSSPAHQRTLELVTDQEEEAAGSSSSDLVSVTAPTAAPAATSGSVEEDDDDNDLLMISNLVFDDDDDLFKGLEEFTSWAGGRGFGQISPSSFGDNFSTSGNGGGISTSPATGGATV